MRLLDRLLSLSSLLAGLVLSGAHPLAPLAVTLVFLGIFLLALWRTRFGVVALLLLLPILNFSPWTGWLIVDEFDLLVLAVVAAGYWRMRRDLPRPRQGRQLVLLLIVFALIARGAHGLLTTDLDCCAGYLSPLNALRVGKSLLWLVLLFPLAAQAVEACSAERAAAQFFGAALIGCCAVVAAAIWERSFHPGLFDWSTPYRTVALFWEMHQGGAALDVYLTLIAPLLVWAWRATASPGRRLALGAFVVLFVYVGLTTFSRGMWAAIAGAMVLLSVLLIRQRARFGPHPPLFSLSGTIVLSLMALEIALVLGAGSFMGERLAAAEHDFGGRWQHWRRGVGLLKTPGDWAFGIGLGRLPSGLMQGDAGLASAGDFRWQGDGGRPRMLVAGPDGQSGDGLGGLHALSQRVELVAGQPYRLLVELRNANEIELLAEVCALHLLYAKRCLEQRLALAAGDWRRVEAIVSGAPFETGGWRRAGHGVFRLSVLTPGGRLEVSNLDLSAGGANLLRNSRFQDQGARWFPALRSYFLPWHIDNFYLEILIETGLSGLLLFLAAVLALTRRLFVRCGRGNPLAAYFLASIAGVLALGLLVSVVDMPRVATLFGLFLVWSWHCSMPCRVADGASRRVRQKELQ